MKLIGERLIAPLLGAPGIKLTDTTLKQNLTDSRVQFETLYELYKNFEPDIMFPFMDLTVEAEALGLKINFNDNKYPDVEDYPIKSEEDFEKIKRQYKGLNGRMKVFVDVVNKMRKELPSKVKVCGYVVGSFTLLGELMGVQNACNQVSTNSEFIQEQLEFYIEVISEYCNTMFDAGADAIAILEPVAMLLSSEDYREYSLKPFKKILEKVKDKSLILHICGDTKHLIKDMAESGAIGLSLDAPIDFSEISNQIPKDMCLIGNISPIQVMLNGERKYVEEETRKLVVQMSKRDNFILSTGCDLPMDTPMENIETFIEVAKEWKFKK